jgi:hypothetical protein
MKKLIILLAFGLIINIQTSFAQAKDEYKKALLEMFTASGSDEAYISAIKQMMTMFKDNYKDVPANFWKEAEQEMLKSSIEDLAELLVPVYEKHLTISDLREMTKFYSTPVGKKYAQSMGPIMQESMKVGETWGRKIGEKIAKKISEQ